MEDWEFFRQKAGEEDWLKLESSQPDLPLGRYSIAVCAPHRAGESIEVEVKTRPTEDSVERQTTDQCCCQLDKDGFGIILSAIDFTPGVWEIQCHGDLLSALMGEDWEITFSFRVTFDLEKAMVKLNQGLAFSPSPEDELNAWKSKLIDDVDRTLEETIRELFPEKSIELHPDTTLPTHYSLHLDEDIFTAETTKPIIISGQVKTDNPSPQHNLRLQITLQDPRTGKIVAQLFPPLPSPPFPLTFCYSLTVSSPCESYLLQGEVILREADPNHSQEITRQYFSVTAHWKTLQSLIISAKTAASLSHPPAPLAPLSADYNALRGASSLRWRGIFPPQLSAKTERKKKKKTPPTLPKLPSTQTASKKEYVWSKPEDQPSSSEWELIPELAITLKDET